jgi:hypothetical protein
VSRLQNTARNTTSGVRIHGNVVRPAPSGVHKRCGLTTHEPAARLALGPMSDDARSGRTLPTVLDAARPVAHLGMDGESAPGDGFANAAPVSALAMLSSSAVMEQLLLPQVCDDSLAAQLLQARGSLLASFAPHVGADAAAFQAAVAERSHRDASCWPSEFPTSGDFVASLLRGYAKHLSITRADLIERARPLVQAAPHRGAQQYDLFNTKLWALNQYVHSLGLDQQRESALCDLLEGVRDLSMAMQHIIWVQGYLSDGRAASGVIPSVQETHDGRRQEILRAFYEREGIGFPETL